MEQRLFTQLMCLISYPLRLGRQELFISKCWPSPLLMFSVTSKENECKHLSGWLLHRSGKSEFLSMRVDPMSPASPFSGTSALWRCPHCVSSTHVDHFHCTRLSAGIACARSWNSLNGSQMCFPSSKHVAYHYWIHTQAADKHPHTSQRKDVIAHFIVSTLSVNVIYLWGVAQVGTVKAQSEGWLH